MIKVTRKYSKERIARAFALFNHLSDTMTHYESCRKKGMHGIAVDDDYFAKRWQNIQGRVEKLESWLSFDDNCSWFVSLCRCEQMGFDVEWIKTEITEVWEDR